MINTILQTLAVYHKDFDSTSINNGTHATQTVGWSYWLLNSIVNNHPRIMLCYFIKHSARLHASHKYDVFYRRRSHQVQPSDSFCGYLLQNNICTYVLFIQQAVLRAIIFVCVCLLLHLLIVSGVCGKRLFFSVPSTIRPIIGLVRSNVYPRLASRR